MASRGVRCERGEVARLAAMMMAESGIQDYAQAKRKAARQLGLGDRPDLPSNEEVDAALKAHMVLFDADYYARALPVLRSQALAVMRRLARFQPLLGGGLLQGAVSRYSCIELDIYADSTKDIETYLLNAGVPFKTEERPDHSVYVLHDEPTDVRLRVYPMAMRWAERRSDMGKKRLNAAQLAQLIETDTAMGD